LTTSQLWAAFSSRIFSPAYVECSNLFSATGLEKVQVDLLWFMCLSPLLHSFSVFFLPFLSSLFSPSLFLREPATTFFRSRELVCTPERSTDEPPHNLSILLPCNARRLSFLLVLARPPCAEVLLLVLVPYVLPPLPGLWL